jgi:OmpA-OmpF porin, OOP family
MRQAITLACGLVALLLVWWLCGMREAAPPVALETAANAVPAARPSATSVSDVPPVPIEPLLLIDHGERIALSGAVATDAQRGALIERVETAFPGRRVEPALTLRPEHSNDRAFAARIEAFPPELAAVVGVAFKLEARRALLEGEVASQAIADALGRALTERFGATIQIDNRLVVSAAASLSAQGLQSALNLSLSDRVVEFESGSDQLSAGGRALLDELLVLLNAQSVGAIEIRGHTDAQGSARGNQRLSERRARSVQRYLEAGGYRGQLRAVGVGEAEPIADESTAEGRQRNRRIEFKVLEE